MICFPAGITTRNPPGIHAEPRGRIHRHTPRVALRCGALQRRQFRFEIGRQRSRQPRSEQRVHHEIRHATQGRMALQGGVSSATIVSGPVEAIRREVAQRLWQLGRDGGYFCGPDQGMPWPEAHIRALHNAVDDLGAYPLNRPLLVREAGVEF